MIRPPRLAGRQWLIVIHDLLATAAALVVTLVMRFEDAQLVARLDWLPALLIGFVNGVSERVTHRVSTLPRGANAAACA